MTRGFTLLSLRRSLGVALVAALGATTAFAPPAGATYHGTNGPIVFAAQTSEHYQLYTVRPNGDDLTQITHVAGDAIQPHWSPDGDPDRL